MSYTVYVHDLYQASHYTHTPSYTERHTYMCKCSHHLQRILHSPVYVPGTHVRLSGFLEID